MLRVIELFAGIGSQTQALKNLGIPHEVVAISEIDKYAITSYESLHGKVNNLGDIRQITELPQADLWTYSFPCQDISVAGKQAGIKDGTRSGLLKEVERLLICASESTENKLPKYLLLENVKNLVGRQFKGDFEKWIAFLSSLGYKTYWQVLNAKHYGIPQNRERVFAVSILGEHEPFIFPKKQELKLRLRDMIDEIVDEKFYLSERALTGILNTNFQQAKKRIDNVDVCRTLLARDYKDPQCIQVGMLGGGKWDKMHDLSRRVYEPDGLSPTIHCAGGGNTEPKIIDNAYRCRPPRVYDKIAPALRSEWRELKVVTGQSDIKIAALRGRDKEGGGREQRLEENKDGTTNALTTVQKDNLLLEQNDTLVARGYKEFIEKNGYIPELFNAYNCAEIKDTAPTMTTQCGSASSSASILKLGNPYILNADAEVAKTIRVGGRGDIGRHCWNVIQVRESVKSIINNIRIRKLTPRECLRLMGWIDAQIDRIVAAGISNSQQYRQAGNGIVVQVLEAVFGQLFLRR